MAALLVALGVMAVGMTVALPAWRHMLQREKEEELIFRGQQYARAVGLFQRKFAATYPPDVKTLVDQKFLRKKYRDPMVEDGEFQVLYQGSLQQRERPRTAGAPGAQVEGRGRDSSPRSPGSVGGVAGPRGGVIGVVSTSTETSIRIYNGRTQYNEWQFIYAPPAGAGQARPGMGGRGGRGFQGGRGQGGAGRGADVRSPGDRRGTVDRRDD